METLLTPIQEYYGNSVIFVVGASGLIGSLLIEKLLRTCTDLKKIYILLRNKKGISSEERFRTFFDRPIFEKVKAANPVILNRVIMVSGDCYQPNLGLSDNDLRNLTNEVNCIFYCAANINFEEKFRTSVTTNVVAVRDLFNIAKSMHDLKSIVYVSTAFFHGLKQKRRLNEEIDDLFNNKLPEQLQTLCDNFDDKQLEKFKANMIDNDTNIYATTKWAAEILIKKVGEGLPVAGIRPSMITPTESDPLPGWIDNCYGPTGLCINISLGFFRVVLLKSSCKIDLIPADYVSNCMIASAWDIFRQINNDVQKTEKTELSTVKIYNCVSSCQNPITYGKAMDLFRHFYQDMPFSMQMIYDKVVITSNVKMYFILKYILCIIPLHIIQLMSYCIFKPIKIFSKIRKDLERHEKILTFALCDWIISDDNVRILWENLNDEDKIIYNFDVKNIDWNLYFKSYVQGVRIYLFKDQMKTVPEAVKRRLKLKKIFYSANILILLSFLFIVYLFYLF